MMQLKIDNKAKIDSNQRGGVMHRSTLLNHGWRRIASDAHAAQLLRRELKHHAKWQQRLPALQWDMRELLAFKCGNYYKFIGNPQNCHCATMVWRMPSEEE